MKTRTALRLPGYDDARPGMYFVTICLRRRKPMLGQVEGDTVRPSWLGEIVATEIQALESRFANVTVDVSIVMPDHAHLILALGTDTRRLGTVIGSLKAASAREINRVCGTTGSPLWQRGYYDHVIRDGCALPLRQPHNDREQATLTAASPRDSLRDPRRQRSYDCFTAKLYYSIVYSMKTPARFVTMQARGLIALPHDLRARHGLDTPGAQVEVLEREDGVIELRPHIAVPADQAWFWSARWQALERVVDEHVARGETETFETSEDFLSSLDRFPGGR